jgi:hypothetical protein
MCTRVEHHLGGRVRNDRRAGVRQVGPRGDRHGGRREHVAGVAQRQQQGQRQAAASRVSGDGDGGRVDPGVEQPAVRRQGIVERGWVAMLRRVAVADVEHPCRGHVAEQLTEAAVAVQRAEAVATPAQGDHGARRDRTGHGQPLARHAAGINGDDRRRRSGTRPGGLDRRSLLLERTRRLVQRPQHPHHHVQLGTRHDRRR